MQWNAAANLSRAIQPYAGITSNGLVQIKKGNSQKMGHVFNSVANGVKHTHLQNKQGRKLTLVNNALVHLYNRLHLVKVHAQSSGHQNCDVPFYLHPLLMERGGSSLIHSRIQRFITFTSSKSNRQRCRSQRWYLILTN